MKKENYRNYQFTADTTSRRKPDGAAALKHTSDVFVPPHLAHDPLDDLYGNRREAERRQQLQEEETRRRKRRIKREKIKKKRKQKRKGRLTAVGTVLFVLLLWVFLRFAAVPFGTLVIQGNETLTTDDVYRAGGIPGYVNVVQLSPDELKDRLEKDLRISSAVVERQFPATIQVTLTERKAAAIVMTMYGFAYVDKDGVVIELEPQIQGVSVPIMTGKKVDTLLLGDTIADPALRAGLEYLQNLPPDVLKHMAEINVGNPDNIIAYTTDSLPVHLGKGDKPVERAAITDELLKEVDSNHLLVQYIDTTPGAPAVKSK